MTPTVPLKLSIYNIKRNPPSSFLIIFVIISNLLSIGLSQSTVATQNETATKDIYYASRDTSNTEGFKLGNIECATDKDCIVYCDIVNFGCDNTVINAQNARSLYVECNAISACSNSFVVNGPTGSNSEATIICNTNTACGGGTLAGGGGTSTLNLDNTPQVNLICTGGSGPNTASCLNLKVYTSGDVNNANISCGTNDCIGLELHTKPASLNTFLTCDGETSCTGATTTCVDDNGESDLTWNAGDNEWTCSDQSCCPLIDNEPFPVLDIGQFAAVECSTVLGGCENRYIDGSDLSISLTVDCTGGSCAYSKIICPPSQDCVVNCGANLCQDILIDARLSNSLSLTCTAVSACERADVYCSNDEDSCYVECGGSAGACNNMQILKETTTDNSYFDIKCPPPLLFADACSNIRFDCSTGEEAYLLWEDNIQRGGGQCVDVSAECCPFKTSAPTAAPETTIEPTSSGSTPSPQLNGNGGTSQPSTSAGATGGDNEGESGELIYIIIGGFGILALCVCFWGGFIWWQKKKNAGYGNEGGRGSKSSRGNNKHKTTGTSGNYNTGSQIHDTGSQTNPGAYGHHHNGGGATPMMGHNISDKPSHLEIEKSMEMPSTTQASITEPTRTANTITAYNPNYKKHGAGATITAYSRNTSNAPPPSLGLADLGDNNGW